MTDQELKNKSNIYVADDNTVVQALQQEKANLASNITPAQGGGGGVILVVLLLFTFVGGYFLIKS